MIPAPIAFTLSIIGLLLFCGLSGVVINRRSSDGN